MRPSKILGQVFTRGDASAYGTINLLDAGGQISAAYNITLWPTKNGYAGRLSRGSDRGSVKLHPNFAEARGVLRIGEKTLPVRVRPKSHGIYKLTQE